MDIDENEQLYSSSSDDITYSGCFDVFDNLGHNTDHDIALKESHENHESVMQDNTHEEFPYENSYENTVSQPAELIDSGIDVIAHEDVDTSDNNDTEKPSVDEREANSIVSNPSSPIEESSIEADLDSTCCRVCHMPGDENQPLFHPCKCSGSIKYVHQECLKQWLKVSKKDSKCELCGVKYSFRKIYKPHHYHIITRVKDGFLSIYHNIPAIWKGAINVLCRLLNLFFYFMLGPMLSYYTYELCIAIFNDPWNLNRTAKIFSLSSLSLNALMRGWVIIIIYGVLREGVSAMWISIVREYQRIHLVILYRELMNIGKETLQDDHELTYWLDIVRAEVFVALNAAKEAGDPLRISALELLHKHLNNVNARNVIPNEINLGYKTIDVKANSKDLLLIYDSRHKVMAIFLSKFPEYRARLPMIFDPTHSKLQQLPRDQIKPSLEDLISETVHKIQHEPHVIELWEATAKGREGLLGDANARNNVNMEARIEEPRDQHHQQANVEPVQPAAFNFLPAEPGPEPIVADEPMHPTLVPIDTSRAVATETGPEDADEPIPSVVERSLLSTPALIDSAVSSPAISEPENATVELPTSSIDTATFTDAIQPTAQVSELIAPAELSVPAVQPADIDERIEQDESTMLFTISIDPALIGAAIPAPADAHVVFELEPAIEPIQPVPINVAEPPAEPADLPVPPAAAPDDVHVAVPPPAVPVANNHHIRYLSMEEVKLLFKRIGFVAVYTITFLIVPRWLGYHLLSMLELSSYFHRMCVYVFLWHIKDAPSTAQYTLSLFAPENIFNESFSFASGMYPSSSITLPYLDEAISINTILSYANDTIHSWSSSSSFTASTGIPIQFLLSQNQLSAVNNASSYANTAVEVLVGWCIVLVICSIIGIIFSLYHRKYTVKVFITLVDDCIGIRPVFRTFHKLCLAILLFVIILPLTLGYVLYCGLVSTIFKSLILKALYDQPTDTIDIYNYRIVPILSLVWGFLLTYFLTDMIIVILDVVPSIYLTIFPTNMSRKFISGDIFSDLHTYTCYDIIIEFSCWIVLGLIMLLFCWILPLKFGYMLFFSTMEFVLFEDTSSSPEIIRAMDTLILHVVWPIIFENINKEKCIRKPLDHLIRSIASITGLQDYLVTIPPVDPGAVACGDTPQQPSCMIPRIVISCIMFFFSLFITWSFFLNAPGSIGNLIVNTLHLPRVNGISPIIIGFAVLWFSSYIFKYIINDYYNLPIHDFTAVQDLAIRWTRIVSKCSIILVLSLSIPPVLIGLLWEYWYLIPMFGKVHETPIVSVFRAWVYGLTSMRFGVKLMMLGLGVDEATRALLDRLAIAFQFNAGLDNALDMKKIMSMLIIPCYLLLLDFICIPYAAARILAVFYPTYTQRTRIMRMSFLAYVCFRLGLAIISRMLRMAKRYMTRLRESMYVVETELTNRS